MVLVLIQLDFYLYLIIHVVKYICNKERKLNVEKQVYGTENMELAHFLWSSMLFQPDEIRKHK